MRFKEEQLRKFALEALRSNTAYYVERRRLLDLWIQAYDPVNGPIELPVQICVQVRSHLQRRSDSLDNVSQYAFENAIHKILEIVGAGAVVVV